MVKKFNIRDINNIWEKELKGTINDIIEEVNGIIGEVNELLKGGKHDKDKSKNK